MIIGYVYWTLRFAERDQWLWADSEDTLGFLRMADDAGYAPAVKHAYRFCRQTKTPMQPWIVKWTEEVLLAAARTTPRPKKKPGRRKGSTPEQFMKNLSTFVLVNFFCQQVRSVYRSGKPYWISPALACAIVNRIAYNIDFGMKKRDLKVPATVENYRLTFNKFLDAAGGIRFSKRSKHV